MEEGVHRDRSIGGKKVSAGSVGSASIRVINSRLQSFIPSSYTNPPPAKKASFPAGHSAKASSILLASSTSGSGGWLAFRLSTMVVRPGSGRPIDS